MPLTNDNEELMMPLSMEDKERIRETAQEHSDPYVDALINRMISGETFEQAEEYAKGMGI